MEERPMVSAIVPVFNCERYLAEAIESMLAQTYRPLEVVVVDDGSTDGSADVARRYVPSVRYDFQPHSGIAATRNRAMTLARGNFFAFLDSDDIWQHDMLAVQMEIFQKHPELDMLFGHASEFVSPELDEQVASRIRYHPEPMASLGPGAIIKASAFQQVGPFQTQWRVGEFIDWHLRASEMGLKSLMLPHVVLRRRLHTTNQGSRERDSRVDFLHILKASLDRRRRIENERSGS